MNDDLHLRFIGVDKYGHHIFEVYANDDRLEQQDCFGVIHLRPMQNDERTVSYSTVNGSGTG